MQSGLHQASTLFQSKLLIIELIVRRAFVAVRKFVSARAASYTAPTGTATLVLKTKLNLNTSARNSQRWGYRHVPHLRQKSETILPQGEWYVSKMDAMHLLQTDDEQIDQLIEMGRLKSMVRSKGKKRLILVELMDIARLVVASESI